MRLCESAFSSFPVLLKKREEDREGGKEGGSVRLDFYRKVISPQPRVAAALWETE